MNKLAKIIKRFTRKKNCAWVVLMYDGHRYYWSSNVFVSRLAADVWRAEFNLASQSIKAESVHKVGGVCDFNGQVDQSIN